MPSTQVRAAQWQYADVAGDISGELYRLVESQERVATAYLVDDLEEQALLEQLLDESKPPYIEDAAGYHYLLTTPFRYPPLKWGSRFGSKYEPGLFYGGLTADVTLAESAYYRFIYLQSMEGEPPSEFLSGQHTLFKANYRTNSGLKLQNEPFNESRAELTDKRWYRFSQRIGKEMRAADVIAFEYESARLVGRLNIALFELSAFAEKQPTQFQSVISKATSAKVQFSVTGDSKVYTFTKEAFEVDGEFPLPSD